MTGFRECRNQHTLDAEFSVEDDTRLTCQLEELMSELEGFLGLEPELAFGLLAEPAQL